MVLNFAASVVFFLCLENPIVIKVIAIIIMIGFVLLGTYILKTSNTLIGQIIGWTNILFFSGFLVWAFIKYMTNKKR